MDTMYMWNYRLQIYYNSYHFLQSNKYYMQEKHHLQE